MSRYFLDFSEGDLSVSVNEMDCAIQMLLNGDPVLRRGQVRLRHDLEQAILVTDNPIIAYNTGFF